MEAIEEKEEIINEDIPDFAIEITFGKTDYEKKSLFLVYQLSRTTFKKIWETTRYLLKQSTKRN